MLVEWLTDAARDPLVPVIDGRAAFAGLRA